jgi:hypothetical protein
MEVGIKPQNGQPIMGVDASGNAQFMRSDASGNVSNTPVPSGATSITGSSGNVAAGTATATLAGVSNKTTYITGFQVTAGGATGAALVTVTVAGVITASMLYTFAAPAGVTLGATPLIVSFNPPVPASAANTAITVSMPTLGAGNTNTTIVAQGYQL